MDLLVNFQHNFQELDELSDDRIRGYPLIDSIWTVLGIMALYNFLIWKGVKYMKNRQPYKLKYPSLIYNFCILLINAYVVVTIIRCGFIGRGYNFLCNEITKNNTHPLELQLVRATYTAYISKYIELLDTAFIVLAKRDRNLSFLHIYHHSTVLINWWILEKWYPTGDTAMAHTINCSVHVIMYLYYGLSTLGPKVAKFLWWKKYLTMLQLIQFFYIMYTAIYGITMNCPFYPNWYNAYISCYLLSLVVLFSYFFLQTYSTKKQKTL